MFKYHFGSFEHLDTPLLLLGHLAALVLEVIEQVRHNQIMLPIILQIAEVHQL